MKKKLILLFLVSLLMVGCYTNPKNLKDLRSEFVSMDDSVSIHYKKWGEGNKTICFVHGFGCDLSTWERQFEGLRDEKGLQLVFVDLPGFGESSKPHVEYTLNFFARAVCAVLDKENVGDVILVGHSLGTPICQQLILNGRKGKLVDIDGVYCFYDGNDTPEYIKAVNRFGHAFDGADYSEIIEGFVTSLAGPETPQDVTDYAMSVMPNTPQHVASSTMRNLVQRQWWPQTPIRTKTMVICTQNSGIESDNYQKMKRLYPRLDYSELVTCGHFIHMEQPDMINAKLINFSRSSP